MEKTKEEMIIEEHGKTKEILQDIFKIYDEVMPGWIHGNCYSAVKMVVIAKRIAKKILENKQ